MKVAEKNARVPSLLLLEQRSEARHIHLVEPTAASRLAVLKNKGVEGPGSEYCVPLGGVPRGKEGDGWRDGQSKW